MISLSRRGCATLAAAFIVGGGLLVPVVSAPAGAVPAGGDVPSGLTQWTLAATDNSAGSYFGNAVAVSGITVVVGAYDRTVGGKVEEGAVEVFTRSATGWGSQK